MGIEGQTVAGTYPLPRYIPPWGNDSTTVAQRVLLKQSGRGIELARGYPPGYPTTTTPRLAETKHAVEAAIRAFDLSEAFAMVPNRRSFDQLNRGGQSWGSSAR
jgi:hypothetical protein